jgi:hypothetical protein
VGAFQASGQQRESDDKGQGRRIGTKLTQASHATPGLLGGIKLDPSSDNINANLVSPCTNCTVLKAIANLAYRDGSQADVGSGIYTHHIIMTQVRFLETMKAALEVISFLTVKQNRLAGDS